MSFGPRPSSRIVSLFTSLIRDPIGKAREIDDDVVALRYALLIQGCQRDGVDDQVPVIGDELEGHGTTARISQRQLDEPRHAGIENAETVLSRQHLHEGRIGEVDEWHIAEEAVGGEDVEEVLALLIERRIGHDQVDVEIEVAEVQPFAARQAQIDPVAERFVATIRPAVIIDHPEIAFVDILSGEEEAMVVGPHGALQLAEIAGNIDETAIAVGSRCAAVRRLRVDFVAPGERGAPAIVVEGAGEVVDVGGAVALGTVVSVMKM